MELSAYLVLSLLYVFVPETVIAQTPPCFSGNGFKPFSSYCPEGYKHIMDCLFAKKYKVKLCYKLPPTTTSKSLPSTQPNTAQTTQPTTTVPTTTVPTTTVPTTTVPTTTVPTTIPTTTVPTTLPTTTVPTTQPTTVPTTTPQPRGCGTYPAEAFTFGMSSATQCQPWLGFGAYKGSYMNNAILIDDDTVLSIEPIYSPKYNPDYYFGKEYNKPITGDGVKRASDANTTIEGKHFVLSKLKESLNISRCVNPICIPKSKSDYSMDNCFAATYTEVSKADRILNVEIGKTRLIDGKCMPTGQPAKTICAYNFAQICNKYKQEGGALICKSKTDNNSWMLAGLTRDNSQTAGCKQNAWNEPVLYWDAVEIINELDSKKVSIAP